MGKLLSTPRSVDIAITGKCNLNCAYCFYADEMTYRNDLTTEQWKAFFNVLGEARIMNVCLTGGEVFTRSDFFELVDNLIKNHMRYEVLSNGTLITERIIEEFKKGKRLQRLNSIQISIDGSSSQVHDKSRPNSFNRALRGLKLLKNAGFPLTVRVTINRYNYNDLDKIAELLLEDIGLFGFSTNEAYPCGATNRFEEGIMLTVPQRFEVMAMLEKLNLKYENRISANAGPLFLLEKQKNINKAMNQGISLYPNCGYLTACGGVFEKIAVLHDGEIVPCHVISDLHLGNILEDDFIDVWKNHLILEELRDRQKISLNTLEPCKTCNYSGYCTGGCPGGALFLNGDFNTRNPMDCYRILIGEEIYKPNKLRRLNE
jgi:SynChlorMet cassette radical SAM/SPASM protein ScmE